MSAPRAESAAGAPAAGSAPPAGGAGWRPRLRWFAAEILVVVAGVLIALALNAWWQGRERNREEQRLLVALHDEFSANRERLARILAFHEDVKETARTLLAVSAEPAADISADSADQLLTDVSWWGSYTSLETTVLDAAVQDAQLDLIETDSLRRMLATWRTEVADAAAQSHQEFTHFADTWLPLLRTEADLAQIANKAAHIPGSNEPYPGAPIPLTLDRQDHRSLIRTRAVRNALVQKLWIEDDVLYHYRGLEPLLDRIVGALQHEIRGRGRAETG